MSFWRYIISRCPDQAIRHSISRSKMSSHPTQTPWQVKCKIPTADLGGEPGERSEHLATYVRSPSFDRRKSPGVVLETACTFHSPVDEYLKSPTTTSAFAP